MGNSIISEVELKLIAGPHAGPLLHLGVQFQPASDEAFEAHPIDAKALLSGADLPGGPPQADGDTDKHDGEDILKPHSGPPSLIER